MKKKRMIGRFLPRLAAAFLSVLLTACSAAPDTAQEAAKSRTADAGTGLEVHFIDVGQGDSALALCDGHAMLIDAGENDKGTTVQYYLQQQGVEKLDYVIATHPDSDHIGGIDVILYKFPVDTLLMPDEGKDTRTYEDVVQVVEDKAIHRVDPDQGDVYPLGSASFTVVSANETYDDVNDASIGIRLSFGETDFLFCGDADRDAEDDMLASGEELEAEVYKVSHHGSSTSSQAEFLDAMDPEYAVISCGEDNDYGHPHKEVMARLEERHVKVFRTDEQGSIVAVTDGEHITWSSGPASGDEDAADGTEKEASYVLNTNTKKFHRPDCGGAADISEKNRQVSHKDREELIQEGYSPCGRCDP